MNAETRLLPLVHNSATYAALLDVFGPARLGELLHELDREIGRRFDTPASDKVQLGRDAHAMVSVSGALGFEALSDACAALEAACHKDGDAVGPCRVVQSAAADARARVAALRAELG